MKQNNSTGVKRKTNLTRSNFSSPCTRAYDYMRISRREYDISRRVRTGRLGKSAAKVFYPTPVSRCACRSWRSYPLSLSRQSTRAHAAHPVCPHLSSQSLAPPPFLLCDVPPSPSSPSTRHVLSLPLVVLPLVYSTRSEEFLLLVATAKTLHVYLVKKSLLSP